MSEKKSLSKLSKDQQSGLEQIISLLEDNRYNHASKVMKELKIPKENIYPFSEQRLIQNLSEGWVKSAVQIKDEFDLPKDIVQGAAEQGLIQNLSKGRVYYAVQIKAGFDMPQNIVYKSEVQQAAEQGLETSKILIGLGNSDALKHLPSIKNTFLPQLPVGYSDKYDQEILVLNLTNNEKGVVSEKKNTFAEKSIKGIEPLTFEDTIPVSYLEEKIYDNNEEMVEGFHEMQNCLTAKDLNNSTKNRPNLSLKYKNQKGTLQGYLIAYEGIKDNQPVIYLADLASTSKIGAGRLIKKFIQLYQENYLEQNKLIPIHLEAREKTTHKLLNKQLKKITNNLNINYKTQTHKPYQQKQDTIHPTTIIPIRN